MIATIKNLYTYAKEVQKEARRVEWPTMSAVIQFALVVGAVVAIMSLFFLLSDYCFYHLVQLVMKLGS